MRPVRAHGDRKYVISGKTGFFHCETMQNVIKYIVGDFCAKMVQTLLLFPLFLLSKLIFDVSNLYVYCSEVSTCSI